MGHEPQRIPDPAGFVDEGCEDQRPSRKHRQKPKRLRSGQLANGGAGGRPNWQHCTATHQLLTPGTEADLSDSVFGNSPYESLGQCTMDKDRIVGSAKDFAGKVEGTVGGIAGDARTQAAGQVREATGTAQNLYGQAKDAARETADAAVNYAKDAYENGGDTFRDGSQAIAEKVQKNPLRAMLIAGWIGFALALLMTRLPPRSRYFG